MTAPDRRLVEDTERGVILEEIPVLISVVPALLGLVGRRGRRPKPGQIRHAQGDRAQESHGRRMGERSVKGDVRSLVCRGRSAALRAVPEEIREHD